MCIRDRAAMEACKAEHAGILGAMEAELASLKEGSSDAALELANAEGRISEMQGQAEAVKAEHAAAVSALDAEICSLRESSSGSASELTAAQGRLTELEGQVASGRRRWRLARRSMLGYWVQWRRSLHR
eukprot:TRINITY_DN20641_c0_g1_i1.p2 TRINITY_DN20641_c0_g1~~TRINITY_DN20641_c0_g1_i1.p2  ORF type:complete len:129 (-),score=40.58 TRINITY_DN20641_c0_g1_i1:563-949(-)